ncbi:MAG: SDR family oxidoreductase [Planctomycetota bacterium]|nr:SDR family oxidoreductase [Planctomycetota bacterium]
MSKFVDAFGPWAIVTGASSGVGSIFAEQLAERGLNLVLIARREDRLRELAQAIEDKHGVETRVIVADLSTEDFLSTVRDGVDRLEIGLLVNNAGFATSGELTANELQREVDMLAVNCRAPLMLTHEFGGRMQQRGRGGIINVASIVAFSGVPGWSHYAATKSYVLTLNEGLAKDFAKRGVQVVTVCPGAMDTEFWSVAGGKPMFALKPARVVKTAIGKLGRRAVTVPGFMNWCITWSTRFMPRTLCASIFGVVIGMMLKPGAKK